MSKRIVFCALFETFLVVSLAFVFAISTSDLVYAQSLVDNRVCCQQALIDGETSYCQYTDSSNCVGGSGIPSRCEDTGACRPVCCDLNSKGYSESGGLGCYQNVPANYCTSELGGTVVSDPTCNTASQCQLGCCIIGNQGTLTTQAGCTDLTSSYPDLELNYRTDITTEFVCINLARAQVKGCCLSESSDSGSSCKLSTLGECSGGQFFESQDCINVPENKCEQCKPSGPVSELTKHCNYDVGDDVYYYDKCDNPIIFGDVADECNYPGGFLCKEDDGEASCDSLNCASGTLWDNPRMDENGNCPDGASVDHQCWKDDSLGRINGESWCEYDADAGPTRDLPGSRHYRHYCYEGREYVEECTGFREEYCLQFDGLEQTVAKCLPNRAIENPCGACEDRECCENTDLRDCVWLAASQEDLEGQASRINDIRRIRDPNSQQISLEYTENEAGVCLPIVSPGTRDDASLCGFRNSDEEFSSDLEIKVAWHNAGWGADWDCDGPCETYTQKFAYQYNILCDAQGDCGASYNLAGSWSREGFERTCDVSSEISSDYDDGDVDVDDYIGYYGDDEVDGLIQSCLESLPDPAERTNGELFFEKYLNYRNILNVRLPPEISDPSFWIETFLGDTLSGTELVVAGSATFVYLVLAATSYFTLIPALTLTATVAAPFPIVNIIVFVIVAAIIIISLSTGGSSEETVTLSCGAWVPPAGSENCNLCHEPGGITYKLPNGEDKTVDADFTADGLHKCTEYLCWSLGQGCEFVSDTEEGPKCLGACANRDNGNPDINFNINQISSLDLSEENSLKCTMTQDFNSEEKNCAPVPSGNGYTLEFVKANTDIVVGVETTEIATCRWDWLRPTGSTQEEAFNNLGKSFDQISAATKHTVTLEANVGNFVPESSNTMYVACLDTCDNTNYPQLYTINVNVGKMQDFGAPGFLGIDPPSGSAVPYYLEDNKTIVHLKLNEPAYCRWSRLNDFYDAMPETNQCRTANSGDGCEIEFRDLIQGVNNFFIRCSDIDENRNLDAIPSNEGYTLFRSDPLQISNVLCENRFGNTCGDILDRNFTLIVSTLGGGYGGKAVCYAKEAGDLEFDFRFTNSSLHRQTIGPKSSGNYTTRIRCIDDVGNEDIEFISYNLVVDESAPNILKLNWQGENLNLLTDENTICRYAINNTLNYNDMTVFTVTGEKNHGVSLDLDYAHVKCQDMFNYVTSVEVYKTT